MGSWHPFPSGGRGSFNLDTLKGSRERGAGFLSLSSGQHLIYSPADTRRQLASSCTHSCRSSPRAWALPPRWSLGSPRADDRTGKLPPPRGPFLPCVLPGFAASCAASAPGGSSLALCTCRPQTQPQWPGSGPPPAASSCPGLQGCGEGTEPGSCSKPTTGASGSRKNTEGTLRSSYPLRRGNRNYTGF